jgi:nanoRNase/pAp phosphatase (c-di-AMP/oligoRNAs hydrolase)
MMHSVEKPVNGGKRGPEAVSSGAVEEVVSSRRPGPRAAELLAALEKHRGGRHVILIRGYPDPDSLASAWAHARLAASIGIVCDIAHLPCVSRPENRAMVNLLEMPLVRLAAPSELSRYTTMSLVDANAFDRPEFSALPCATIVDHHGIAAKPVADFVDIRTSVGSTSTIYTEYLRDVPGALDADGMATRLGTALAYGIRSDTDDLLAAHPTDLLALAHLMPVVDRDLLAMLSRYAISAPSMSVTGRALDAMQIEGTWAFAGVGVVRAQDRDSIGQAADFLVRREGTRTAITYGLVDGFIDGSLRSTDPSLDPAAWLREAFGVGPLGLPYGGGRRGKGGFQIPLGPLASCGDQKALWKVVKETIESTIKRQLGASGRDEAPPSDEHAA